MIFWYSYCLRIYNEFNWTKSKADWDDIDDKFELFHDIDANKNIEYVNAMELKSETSGVTDNRITGSYLTVNFDKKGSSDPWERRYFILKGY